MVPCMYLSLEHQFLSRVKSTIYNPTVLKYNEQMKIAALEYVPIFLIVISSFSKVAVDSSQLWSFKNPNSKRNKLANCRQQVTSKEEEIERGNSKFGHLRHLSNVICYQSFIRIYVTFGLGMTVRTHLAHRFISCGCWNIARAIYYTIQNTVS